MVSLGLFKKQKQNAPIPPSSPNPQGSPTNSIVSERLQKAIERNKRKQALKKNNSHAEEVPNKIVRPSIQQNDAKKRPSSPLRDNSVYMDQTNNQDLDEGQILSNAEFMDEANFKNQSESNEEIEHGEHGEQDEQNIISEQAVETEQAEQVRQAGEAEQPEQLERQEQLEQAELAQQVEKTEQENHRNQVEPNPISDPYRADPKNDISGKVPGRRAGSGSESESKGKLPPQESSPELKMPKDQKQLLKPAQVASAATLTMRLFGRKDKNVNDQWEKEKQGFWVGLWKKAGWGTCCILLLRLVFSEGGVIDFLKMEKILNEKMQNLSEVHSENEQIFNEILKIQSDHSYQRHLAREHLGVMAQDEFLILFARDKDGKSM